MVSKLFPYFSVLQGEYRILATDYYSYALAWQCDELPLGTAHTRKWAMTFPNDIYH